MATVHKNVPGRMRGPDHGPGHDEQVRHDRIMALVVLGIVGAMVALIIWLGTISNGSTENLPNYWPMM